MPNDKDFELDDLEAFSFDDLSLDEDPPKSQVAGEDPFGVWVKSAPEEVIDSNEITESEEFPVEETLAEEDFLSSKELADLDESFDFVTIDEPQEGEAPLDEEVSFLDSNAAKAAEAAEAPKFDEVSLDDFVSFDDTVPESSAPLEVTGDVAVPEAEEELSEDFLDIDIDIADDIRDEDLEIDANAPAKSDDVSLDSFSAEEVDLSEFGDFEEVEPVAEEFSDDVVDDVADGADDLATEDLLAEETVAAPQEPTLDEALEGIPGLDDLPALDETGFLDEEGFFEEEVLDESPTLDLEPSDETDLDHLKALEETLTDGLKTVEPLPAVETHAVETDVAEPRPAADTVPSQANSELASLILGKLEQELSSIKQEITELKNEVTSLRTAPLAAPKVPEPESEPIPEPEVELDDNEEPATKASHGFFDEEDDETIALTGDELDNLLSTAEISEGEVAGVTLDEDLLPLDGLPLDGLPLDGPSEEVHVSDEEFLAGTALDLNETQETQEDLGVPESIELEEDGFNLEAGDTEDLLGGLEAPEVPEVSDDFPLELPLDDVGVELTADLDGLAPSDPEGWSLPPEPPLAFDPLPPAAPVHDEAPLAPPALPTVETSGGLTPGMKDELRAVLSYMDKLLASLPDDKIQEFAESDHFEVYKRLFEELGLIE